MTLNKANFVLKYIGIAQINADYVDWLIFFLFYNSFRLYLAEFLCIQSLTKDSLTLFFPEDHSSEILILNYKIITTAKLVLASAMSYKLWRVHIELFRQFSEWINWFRIFYPRIHCSSHVIGEYWGCHYISPFKLCNHNYQEILLYNYQTEIRRGYCIRVSHFKILQ